MQNPETSNEKGEVAGYSQESPSKPFCIHTKLRELYLEETARDSGKNTGIKRNSLLLEKLVMEERLNTLILNLYPGNKGYSLAFRVESRTEADWELAESLDETANMIETKLWPYEEDELLAYVDNEKLPAYILDLLEPDFSFLFYSGCVIAEVRDYRQSYPHTQCDIHHVLLRSTPQSIIADVNQLMEERTDYGTEEKQLLESQLILAKTPSLYLEPNVSAFVNQNRICRTHKHLNTHRLRRLARKFSQVTVNRKRKLDMFTRGIGGELFDFLARNRSEEVDGLKTCQNRNQKIPFTPVPELESLSLLSPPSQGVQISKFKVYKHPDDTSDCLPQVIEECILETDMPSNEKGESRVYHIKLSILQRPSNLEYLGELYLDRDYKKGEKNGVACRFSLGTRLNANKYLNQFVDIFTEGGKKAVRMQYMSMH